MSTPSGTRLEARDLVKRSRKNAGMDGNDLDGGLDD